jgi:hypothetical protein
MNTNHLLIKPTRNSRMQIGEVYFFPTVVCGTQNTLPRYVAHRPKHSTHRTEIWLLGGISATQEYTNQVYVNGFRDVDWHTERNLQPIDRPYESISLTIVTKC